MSALYKVTGPNGEPIHNGSGAYSLPTADGPGAWREEEVVELCRRGLHLTDSPAWWWAPSCRIWEVEAEGVEGVCDDAGSRKVVARRVRLLREIVDAAELAELRIYTSGAVEIREGKAVASGSASVEASGSASVVASARVTVVQWRGSCSVRVTERAVCVDRSGDGPPVVRVAEVAS